MLASMVVGQLGRLQGPVTSPPGIQRNSDEWIDRLASRAVASSSMGAFPLNRVSVRMAVVISEAPNVVRNEGDYLDQSWKVSH